MEPFGSGPAGVKRLVAAIVFSSAVGLGAALAYVYDGPEGGLATPNVFVSGGEHTIEDAEDEAVDVAANRFGQPLHTISHPDYELAAIDQSPSGSAVRTAELLYQRKGARDGEGRVTVVQLSGRQTAVTDRLGIAPNEALTGFGEGVEVVRTNLEGGVVGFTAWLDGVTVHFGFYPERPSEGQMIEMVRAALSKSR